MTTLDEERIKILTDAYEHRKREVMHHQINIDNYTLALAEIAEKHPEDEAMAEFANHACWASPRRGCSRRVDACGGSLLDEAGAVADCGEPVSAGHFCRGQYREHR